MGGIDSWTQSIQTIPEQHQPTSSVLPPVGFCIFLCRLFSLLTLRVTKSHLNGPNSVCNFLPLLSSYGHALCFSSVVWICVILLCHTGTYLWGVGALVPKSFVRMGKGLWQRLHQEGLYERQVHCCPSVCFWVVSRMLGILLDMKGSFWNGRVWVSPQTLLEVDNKT